MGGGGEILFSQVVSSGGQVVTSLTHALLMFSQNCVEQLFDDEKVNVSKNGAFAEEFAISIRDWMTELDARIGV